MQKLSIKSALCNSKFRQLVFLICIVCAVIVYFLLTRIDLVVHEDLYNFGLIFSTQWVDPYRALMWLIYACLVTSVVLSGTVLLFDLLAKKQETFTTHSLAERVGKVTTRPLPQKLPFKVETSRHPQRLSEEHIPLEDDPKKASEALITPKKNQNLHVKNTEVIESDENSENRVNNMLISCPKCKRVFQTPLVMLDFSGTKPGLMNVCPYCNQVLGNSEAESDVYFDLT